VHRIDKNTTGLIVLAKTAEAAASLAKQFFNHTVERKYIALVWGDMEQDEGTIIAHVGRHQRFRKMFDAYPEGEHGKHAITHYKVIERFHYVTLVECRLETGRTHQIRVHMASIDHPLLGDPVYGKRTLKEAATLGLARQFLHAQRLGFTLPSTGEWREFVSELPEDLRGVLERLENTASQT